MTVQSIACQPGVVSPIEGGSAWLIVVAAGCLLLVAVYGDQGKIQVITGKGWKGQLVV